jgi:DNA-binding NarL/FixJ family response regulator
VSQARPSTALTPHEALIARFARDRLSNPEIGARPFVSLRTVEYHLHNVLTTLARRAQQRAFPAGRATRSLLGANHR